MISERLRGPSQDVDSDASATTQRGMNAMVVGVPMGSPRFRPRLIDPELRFWLLVILVFIAIGILMNLFWGSL